ncbi:MAG: SRPBCC family protein [Acidimicrobiales bacterium]
MLDVARHLPVPAASVWATLIDTTVWSQWGPSVRGATLDRDGTLLRADSTGRVLTAFGVWLPFRVTDWEPGRRWGWKVAGIPATAHRVEPADGGATSRAVIEIPTWAPFYAPLCWMALGRVGAVAARRGLPAGAG